MLSWPQLLLLRTSLHAGICERLDFKQEVAQHPRRIRWKIPCRLHLKDVMRVEKGLETQLVSLHQEPLKLNWLVCFRLRMCMSGCYAFERDLLLLVILCRSVFTFSMLSGCHTQRNRFNERIAQCSLTGWQGCSAVLLFTSVWSSLILCEAVVSGLILCEVVEFRVV